MTVQDLTPQVKAALVAIADNIEQHGHYQGGGFDESSPDTCCLFANPAYPWGERDVTDAIDRALESALGIANCSGVIDWNDNTPTPVVLATLRELAQ